MTVNIVLKYFCWLSLLIKSWQVDLRCPKPHQLHREFANTTVPDLRGLKNDDYETCNCSLSCDVYTEHYSGEFVNRWAYLNCTQQCVTGCQCAKNYHLDNKGNCVEAKDCPPRCPGPNEALVRNKFPPPCPERSCKTMMGPLPPCSKSVIQVYNYVVGCVCKRGYVRADNGTCILIKECTNYPPQCSDPRKEFKECGSACPPICDYANKPEKCMNVCVSACFCKKGYVMNFTTEECILPEECPARKKNSTIICPDPTQSRYFCAPACRPACNQLIPPVCKLGCFSSCYCKPGFVMERWEGDGTCISLDKCPTKRE